jgi:hypothetical protein
MIRRYKLMSKEIQFSALKYNREKLRELGINPNIIAENKKLKKENKTLQVRLKYFNEKINFDYKVIELMAEYILFSNKQNHIKADTIIEIKQYFENKVKE